MKFAVLGVSAAGVSTVIGPAVAPAGTVAVTEVSETNDLSRRRRTVEQDVRHPGEAGYR